MKPTLPSRRTGWVVPAEAFFRRYPRSDLADLNRRQREVTKLVASYEVKPVQPRRPWVFSLGLIIGSCR